MTGTRVIRIVTINGRYPDRAMEWSDKDLTDFVCDNCEQAFTFDERQQRYYALRDSGEQFFFCSESCHNEWRGRFEAISGLMEVRNV